MKPLILSAFFLMGLSAQAQPKATLLWETDTTLAVPESVLFEPATGNLYVSLIDGGPWEKDGRGGIALLDRNGKIIKQDWATGLHAPKGMGLHGDKLYVADMSDVVVIDRKSGTVEKRIPVEGGEYLNDVTVDEQGTVYVSDSRTGKVYRMKDGRPSLFLSDLKGVNGLKSVGTDLYILTGAEAIKADAAGNRSPVATLDLGGDGIEPVGNGDFIITAWGGLMQYLHADGRKELLLDTRTQNRQTADIGYDPQARIIYVPTFFRKSVAAYQLK